MVTLEQLKDICNDKLQEATKNNNEQKITIYSTIQQMIEIPNALRKIGPEMCFNIFYDLGFDKEQAKDIYNELVIK